MDKKTDSLVSRLDEVKSLFEEAFKKATEAVRIAKEELTRPLSHDEILERDEKGDY